MIFSKQNMALIMIRHFDYFENGTYLGKVFLPNKKASVNGGETQKLIAYNRGGFNYIKLS